MTKALNIIFMHSHNTGTFIQPYGHPVPTPHMQQLAEEGVLFRHAFATAPTCSPSRAGFLTGMHTHCTGLLGLSHRGFSIDTKFHVVQTLKEHGYYTVLSGVEHVTPDIRDNGYDEIISGVNEDWTADAKKDDPATSVVEFLGRDHDKPFFIAMGLQDTHIPFKQADPDNHRAEDWRYCDTFPQLPDHNIPRKELANYKASARKMDEDYGRVLKAVDDNGLRDNTIIFCFCDHGLQVPRHISNLTDHGLRVYLLARGPEHWQGGKHIDQLVSLMDLVPTALDMAGVPIPEHVQGKNLNPLISGKTDTHYDHIFGELNFHAAYEPMRCVRTERFKYIRRYDNRDQPVLPNCDDSPIKDYLMTQDWRLQPRNEEELYDLVWDPMECDNRADDPSMQDTLKRLRSLMDEWQERTNDPIVAEGKIDPPVGVESNDVDGLSPRDKTIQY